MSIPNSQVPFNHKGLWLSFFQHGQSTNLLDQTTTWPFPCYSAIRPSTSDYHSLPIFMNQLCVISERLTEGLLKLPSKGIIFVAVYATDACLQEIALFLLTFSSFY